MDVRLAVRNILHLLKEGKCFVKEAAPTIGRYKSSVRFMVDSTAFVNHSLKQLVGFFWLLTFSKHDD